MGLRPSLAILVFVAMCALGAGTAAGTVMSSDRSTGVAAPGPSTSIVAATTEKETTATIEPPATTAAPTTPSPTNTIAAEPLRITLAGDSVMAGLAPAVEAALEGSGAADVEFVLTPSLLRDDSVRFSWLRELQAFDPDVVVMFVGTWELGEVAGTGEQLGDGAGGWRPAYEENVLDPWIEIITGEGAEVIWIGAPAVKSDDVNLQFLSLNEAYRGLETRWPQVRYLDSTRALSGGEGGFLEVDTSSGTAERLRQVDGLHLCPAGAVRLAEAVIDLLASSTPVAAPTGWESGSWSAEGESYPPAMCPPD